jgi:hypothetical protein
MSFFLGGFRIAKMGLVGPQSVYCDIISAFTEGWVYQLYANRKLIGATREPNGRRIVGQLVGSISPAPLTVVRVENSQFDTDYGQSLPRAPWNRYALYWTVSGSVGVHHFDIVRGVGPGDPVDDTNVLARVAFAGDGDYSFEPDALPAGDWNFGIVPRSDSLPSGIAGTSLTSLVTVVLPPDDVAPDPATGRRFSVASVAGAVAVGIGY